MLYTVGMIEITQEQFRKIERYDTLLRSYQKVLVKNVELQDDNLQKDKLIDHYEKLWKSHKRGL